MQNTKRVTTNLPKELLTEALSITKKGTTETLIKGLELIKRSEAFSKAQKLRGKLNFNIDIDKSRERINS